VVSKDHPFIFPADFTFVVVRYIVFLDLFFSLVVVRFFVCSFICLYIRARKGGYIYERACDVRLL